MKVIVACDGSENGLKALEITKCLPLKDLEVQLICVADTISYSEELFCEDAIEQLEEFNKDIVKKSEDILKEAHKILPGQQILLKGNPIPELLEASKEADMMVMGTRGLNTVKSLLLGSVSDAMIRGAHCSVLICHNEDVEEYSEKNPLKLVLGVDLSGTSSDVLEYLSHFNLTSAHEIHLVTVFKKTSSVLMSGTVALVDRMAIDRSRAAQILEKFTPDISQKFPETKVCTSTRSTYHDIASELNDYAADHQPALLVVGSNRKNLIDRVFLGSTSSQLAQSTKVPLIVIR